MNKFLSSVLCLFFLGLLLTGCHYRFGYGDLASRHQTISVPFIEGDKEGRLTAELVRKLSTSGAFKVVNTGGDLVVKVKIIDLDDINIGFRYDRHKTGRLKKTLIPAETRVKGTVELVVLNTSTQQIVRGPVTIVAAVDFDHDFYSTRNAENIFSLGQLSDIDVAQEVAMGSLNKVLADKIGDYIISSW